jgi:hypothetical protein
MKRPEIPLLRHLLNWVSRVLAAPASRATEIEAFIAGSGHPSGA